jgi:O-antigen/teichoic acid export membrane protein
MLILISNLGGAALLFALSALIARTLGTAGLGLYAVALAWVYPLALLVDAGLTSRMTLDVGADLTRIAAYMETITGARLLIGGAVMLTFWLAAPILSGDPVVTAAFRVSAPMLILTPFYSQFTTVFKARGAMWTIPVLNLGMLAAQVAWTAWALVNGGTVIDALAINTLTSAGQLVAAWGMYRINFNPTLDPSPSSGRGEDSLFAPLSEFGEGRRAPRVGVRSGDEVLLSLLRRAFPFALAALLAAIQMRLGVILLEALVGAGEAGYFSAANRFAEAARMFPNALFGALFPALAAVAREPDRIQQTFRRAAIPLMVFGVASGIGLTLFAPALIRAIYGVAFTPAVPALIVLAWSILFTALRGARTLQLYAVAHERYVNGVNGAAIVVQMVASLWLIPLFGASGAALAFLIAEIAAFAALQRGGNP